MDYVGLRDDLALPLIKENGRPVILTRPGSADGWTKRFDPAGGTWYWEDTVGTITANDPATDVETTGYAIGTKLDYKLLSESLIKSTDKALLIAGLPLLVPGDRITDCGIVFVVVMNQPVQPGDTILVQKVVAR